MAMLLLDEVFAKTWQHFPIACSTEKAPCDEEFWKHAIETIKAEHPDFLFMAEAYWDLEPRLQEAGFDFTYDKRVYDHLLNDEYDGLQARLKDAHISFLSRSVHFLENHDEARAAKLFTHEEHVPAALLGLAIPGLRMIHHGQLEGLRIHQRIQLRRRPAQIPDVKISLFYERLLMVLQQTLVGSGSPRILSQIETKNSVIGVIWTDHRHADIAIVNLGGEPVRAHFDWLCSAQGSVTSIFANDPEAHPAISWSGSILSIDLRPYAAHLLRFE